MVSQRTTRQISQARLARIAGTALATPDGLKLLASKRAADQDALIESLLNDPVGFDAAIEKKRSRIDQRTSRRVVKAERLKSDTDLLFEAIVENLDCDVCVATLARKLAERCGEQTPIVQLARIVADMLDAINEREVQAKHGAVIAENTATLLRAGIDPNATADSEEGSVWESFAGGDQSAFAGLGEFDEDDSNVNGYGREMTQEELDR